MKKGIQGFSKEIHFMHMCCFSGVEGGVPSLRMYVSVCVCECSTWGLCFGHRWVLEAAWESVHSTLTPPANVLVSSAPESLTPSCFPVFMSSSYPLAYCKVPLSLGGIYRPKVTQKGRKGCCFHVLEAFCLSGTRYTDCRASCS